MEYRLIKCESHFNKEVFKIVLNAPKANVLEAAMLKEISSALTGLEKENSLKLLVFEGEGKHFSFGASVPEHTKENAGMMLDSFHAVFYQLVKLAVPTMAVVRGQCLGGGMEVALFWNFIVADRPAAFGQPEIVLAVFPPPASVILPMKVGQSYADDIVPYGPIHRRNGGTKNRAGTCTCQAKGKTLGKLPDLGYRSKSCLRARPA